MIFNKNNIAKNILYVLLITFFLTSYASASETSCISCHEDVRHSSIDVDCQNCHIDDLVDGKHTDQIKSVQNVHEDFDWEDDNTEDLEDDSKSESCLICHVSSNTGDQLICENCHFPDGSVLFKGPSSKYVDVRLDINDIIPRVYSHTNLSEMYISDQTDLGIRESSCFGFNLSSGEGICHSIWYESRNQAGGYFANSLNDNGSSLLAKPYMETNTIDNLPDTSDCKFCHFQDDPLIRKAWGNAKELPSDHESKKSSDCWNCHVIGGKKPSSFHSDSVVMSTENSGLLDNLKYILVVVLFIVGIFAYMRIKQKK